MFLLLGFELQRHAAGSVTLRAESRCNLNPKSRYILTTIYMYLLLGFELQRHAAGSVMLKLCIV